MIRKLITIFTPHGNPTDPVVRASFRAMSVDSDMFEASQSQSQAQRPSQRSRASGSDTEPLKTAMTGYARFSFFKH